MKTIRQRYLIITVMCAVTFIVCLVITASSHKPYINNRLLYIVVPVSLTALLLFLYVREYRNFAFAQLIVDNKIVFIQAAQSELKSLRRDIIIFASDSMDIYVSCFGILLGSRIIKFNTEGIYLKKIDIGNGFIELYFGKEDKEQFIRLLNRTIDENELLHIVEQFRHETGVIPKILA